MFAKDLIIRRFVDDFTNCSFDQNTEYYDSLSAFTSFSLFRRDMVESIPEEPKEKERISYQGPLGGLLLQLVQPDGQEKIDQAEEIIQNLFRDLRQFRRLPYQRLQEAYVAAIKISPVFSVILNACPRYHWFSGDYELFELELVRNAIRQPIDLATDYIQQGLTEPLFFTYGFFAWLVSRGVLEAEGPTCTEPIDYIDQQRVAKRYFQSQSILQESIRGHVGDEFHGEIAKKEYLGHEHRRSYHILCLEHFITASLLEIFRNGYIIKKCENCGRYFIPYQKANAIYCDQPSPQDASKTCKEYAQQRLWYDRIKQDETAKLFRNIYQAKQIRVKRNPGNTILQEDFEHFKAEGKQWKAAVKAGTKTEAEFLAWLQAVKQKKVKKDGNPR